MFSIGPVELVVFFGALYLGYRWLRRRRDDAHEALRLNQAEERRALASGITGEAEPARRLEQ